MSSPVLKSNKPYLKLRMLWVLRILNVKKKPMLKFWRPKLLLMLKLLKQRKRLLHKLQLLINPLRMLREKLKNRGLLCPKN